MPSFKLPSFQKKSIGVETTSQRLVLFIEREQINAQLIDDQGVAIGEPHVFEWNAASLAAVCQQLQTRYSINQVDIIFGQDLALVDTVRIPTIQADPIGHAHQLAQQRFGKSYDQLGIDYSVLTTENPAHTLVQLFVVRKKLLNTLGGALQQVGISVAAIEPLATQFSKLLTFSEPTVVLWGDTYLYAAVFLEGNLVYAKTLSHTPDVYNAITSLLSSIEETHSQTISLVYMATAKLDSSKLKSKHTQVVPADLNPFGAQSAANEDLAIEEIEITPEAPSEPDQDLFEPMDDNQTDSGIMSSQATAAPKPPLKIFGQVEDMESVSTPANRSNTKLLAIMITVLVVLVGMVVGGFFVYRNAMSTASQPPQVSAIPTAIPQPVTQPTPTPEGTASATPTTATGSATPTVANLEVRVLNGSGRPGAAGAVADILKAAGADSIATGNAASYDFDETEIQVKPGQTAIFELIQDLLKDDYTTYRGDDLDRTSEYDLVITAGRS